MVMLLTDLLQLPPREKLNIVKFWSSSLCKLYDSFVGKEGIQVGILPFLAIQEQAEVHTDLPPFSKIG